MYIKQVEETFGKELSKREFKADPSIPFLHNSGEDGSLLNFVQNTTPTLPAALPSVFRTFVNGLKEGLISDAE